MQQISSCPSCGTPIKGDQQFCGICGTKLSPSMAQAGLKCPSCGSPITTGQQFCGTCGARLITPAKGGVAVSTQGVTKTTNSQTSVIEPSPSISIRQTAKDEISRPKYGTLNFAAVLFHVIGWIILVAGCIISIAYIALGAIGAGFQFLLPGAGTIIGSLAIIIGGIGLIVSLLTGFGFLVVARLCYSVIALIKKLYS